jgi:hypothetical protein
MSLIAAREVSISALCCGAAKEKFSVGMATKSLSAVRPSYDPALAPL